MSVEASVHIAAPPEKVYALISDLPSMGKWSPECVRCDWKGGATAPAPGVKFKGHNRIGWRRWSTTGTVVTADPGKELTFDITSVFGLPVARWSYRIEADNGGSRVTESWQDNRSGRVMGVLGKLATGVSDRAEHNRRGMETTLAKIKADAEASA
jgi:uncharacterized protein YndB with AHSA1/START domain